MRRGYTRSHTELGSQALLRQWYFVLRHGRVGRCRLIKKTNVVYGSRVLNKNRYSDHNFSSIFRVAANHILTIFSNILNNQKLTDAHTCYKVFKKDILKKIKLEENGFSFCPELTTKIGLINEKIFEVSIRYKGRSYGEGKKINFKDCIDAIITLIYYKYFNK